MIYSLMTQKGCCFTEKTKQCITYGDGAQYCYDESVYVAETFPFYNETDDNLCNKCRGLACLCEVTNTTVCKDTIPHNNFNTISIEVMAVFYLIGVHVIAAIIKLKGWKLRNKFILNILYMCGCKRDEEKEMLIAKLKEKENESDEGEVDMKDVQTEIERYNSVN